MTSINNNIPTRTFVPTITQQPTNTNTTASAGGASATGSSVPTPTSSLVYTASAPKTQNPEEVEVLERLRKELDNAKAYLDKCEEEVRQLTKQIDDLRMKLKNNRNAYSQRELQIIEDEIIQLSDLRVAYNYRVKVAKKLYNEKLHEFRDYSQSLLSGSLTPTVTGYSPTGTSVAPTVTTGNVPYYPTGT